MADDKAKVTHIPNLDDLTSAQQEAQAAYWNSPEGKKKLSEDAKAATERLGGEGGNLTSPGLTPEVLNAIDDERDKTEWVYGNQSPENMRSAVAKKSVENSAKKGGRASKSTNEPAGRASTPVAKKAAAAQKKITKETPARPVRESKVREKPAATEGNNGENE